MLRCVGTPLRLASQTTNPALITRRPFSTLRQNGFVNKNRVVASDVKVFGVSQSLGNITRFRNFCTTTDANWKNDVR